MNTDNKNVNPVLGLDEIFETGVIVDGTGVNIEDVDAEMKKYLENTK